MAPTAANTTSSIALAFAGLTGSVDIPKPRDANFWAGKDSFAAVTARSVPTKKHIAGLPTPPNSISPSLPPQAFKARTSNGPPTPPALVHVDSDIDLEDAVEHAKAQDTPQHALTARRLGDLAENDAVGAITPGLLAKHHLPGILLDHGPLPIRHVMGYLTTSVPGFAGIPPAKARRLVVGALEGRGSDGQQGGIDGDVIFEKVGWGRWDARRRGQPSRDDDRHHHQSQQRQHSPAPHGSLRIPVQSTRQDRSRDMIFGSHNDSEHGFFDTPMEDISILEHEADKMSLHDTSSYSHSAPSDDKPLADLEMADVTDEEDWASIGAAALRQGSFPLTGGLMPATNQPAASHFDPKSRGRGASGRPPASMARSMPVTNTILSVSGHRHHPQHAHGTCSPLPEHAFRGGDSQDREAVEALLQLSSV